MAKEKFQEIVIISVLELIMAKNDGPVLGPVAWGCISNNIKMLPLHIFSYRVKSRLLAGYWLLCDTNSM